MTSGNNRRAFLSGLVLAGGSAAAFAESFRQDGHGDVRGVPGAPLFEHIQLQLAALLRTARTRGYLTAEDAATTAAFIRVCAAHARGLGLDGAASEALGTRVRTIGRDALINLPHDGAQLRLALRRKGLTISDKMVMDLTLADVAARTAALEAIEQGRTIAVCDRLAAAFEAAAPQLARDQRFSRRAVAGDEAWCSFVLGQWTMYLSLAYYIASFQDPSLQAFLDAMWWGFTIYDNMYTAMC